MKTIYQYQIVGYAPAGEPGVEDVKKEFEKFEKRFRRSFASVQSHVIDSDGKPSGEINNFSLPSIPYFSLTSAWATSKDHQQNLFAITLRFEVKDNHAYLPVFEKFEFEEN